ncbi:plasmid partitioning protein RepB [Cohaesibacter celericrescens]|uniref:plasmid partitioning protein RepB n=1 Tax=Cohaesibacter celericrescens TaxID=2067669 RepID=UPI003561A960
MARKGIFDQSDISEQASGPVADKQDRPLAGMARTGKRSTAIGALSKSLGTISQRADKASELEEKLRAGHAVVELDPALIDGSFVSDRLGTSVEEDQTLQAQIREHGQQVPILVRPNPEILGRYQVAYGHRRLAAVKALGIPVNAVVRELSNEELVVSQGQENNARTDLSYIERSYFAFRLENQGFSRDIIMSAIGVDKAALSRMIALVDKLPSKLIEAIGPAASFGRTRWAALADLVEDKNARALAFQVLEEDGFQSKLSDDRFETVLLRLQPKTRTAQNDRWQTVGGEKAVKISDKKTKLSLVFDKKIDQGFGTFLVERLPELINTFEAEKGNRS